jgi:hypothetical protein
MEEWQNRVIDEQREVSEKIDRLYAFVNAPYTGVSDQELMLLRIQGAVMSLYREILRARIDGFTVKL